MQWKQKLFFTMVNFQPRGNPYSLWSLHNTDAILYNDQNIKKHKYKPVRHV